jgi:acetyltransferase-like isoleucine patch superfamily enzyme
MSRPLVTHRRIRTLLAVVAALLPGGPRRFVHTRLLGHELAPGARIGHSIVDVDHLVMGEGAQIGHLNALRGLEEVRLGEGAKILMLVWVNAVRRSTGYFPGVEGRRPELIMGRHSLISSMHFVDACDLVEIGDFGAIAGFGSIVQTHAVDIEHMVQATRPVRIGEYSMVATRALLLPGAEIPPRSIVAAGSTVTRKLEGSNVFAGSPARAAKPTDTELPFFHRTHTEIA